MNRCMGECNPALTCGESAYPAFLAGYFGTDAFPRILYAVHYGPAAPFTAKDFRLLDCDYSLVHAGLGDFHADRFRPFV